MTKSFAVSAIILAFTFASIHARARDTAFRRQVNLNWTEVPGAIGYEMRLVKILSKGGHTPPHYIKTQKPSWLGEVSLGKYEMQLRSFDKRGVPGPWSPPSLIVVNVPGAQLMTPKPGEVIKTNREDEYPVQFKWQPIPGIDHYVLQVESVKPGFFKKSWTLTEVTKTLDLPVAESYRWQVTSVTPKGDSATVKREPPFTLTAQRLSTPTVAAPMSEFVKLLQWKAPRYAQTYTYALYRFRNGHWQVLDHKKGFKDHEIQFALSNPTGLYQLRVQALAPGRLPSRVASRIFKVRGGLRSPAQLRLQALRASLNKPSRFYAITSYFITQMHYDGFNSEKGAPATFDALGGTGRVGLGYLSPNSPLGYFGIVDLSGFNISAHNYTFAAVELHATYSHYWQTNKLMLSTGFFAKELPEVVGDADSGLQKVGKILNIGPHIGFQVWHPFTPKIGLQFNSRFYLALGGHAPNGRRISSSLSTQLGLLGSYRLTSRLMAFAGYSYRLDRGAYEATPITVNSSSLALAGEENTVTISGNYLNLKLEYSF